MFVFFIFWFCFRFRIWKFRLSTSCQAKNSNLFFFVNTSNDLKELFKKLNPFKLLEPKKKKTMIKWSGNKDKMKRQFFFFRVLRLFRSKQAKESASRWPTGAEIDFVFKQQATIIGNQQLQYKKISFRDYFNFNKIAKKFVYSPQVLKIVAK